MYRISINDENSLDKIKKAQDAGKIVMTRFVGSHDPYYVVFDNEQEMQAETARWEKLGQNLDNLQDLDFNFEENIGEER